MCKHLVVFSIVLFLIIFRGISYPNDKEPLNNPMPVSLSSTEHIEADFSSEYTFAQSSLQKKISTSSVEEKPILHPPVPIYYDDPSISEESTSLYTKQKEIEALYETYGFNKAVEKSLQYYSSKKRKEKFTTILSRSGRYLSMITEIFSERQLPQELVFLPLIESGFNMYAYSPKKASGLWQFIASTAKKYGLKIDWWVDERRDPVKATIAAAEYLSDLYNIFGSWNLSLAAYNAGEGRILKALNKTKTDDFWALRDTKHIKRETKNYVPFYIAATAIAKDPEGFGFQNVSYHEPMEYDEIVIESPMDLEAIARYAEVDIQKIKELNPELKRWCTPPNVPNYILRLPKDTKDKFLANISNSADEENFSIDDYTVKRGDTIKKIASRLGVSTEAIMELNSLGKNTPLKTGSSLLVPPKKFAHLTKDTENTKSKKRPVTYKKHKKANTKKKKPYLVTSTEKKAENPS